MAVASATMLCMEQVYAQSLDPQSVVTPLDPDWVGALLHNYNILTPWSHIITGLHHGFNVGICDQPLHTYLFQESSDLDPAFIGSYILSEQLANHYSQAYSPSELKSLIGPFYTSPLGLVLKPHSTIFQIIQDLSYLWNNPHFQSINAGINLNDFLTKWGTFDVTVATILALPQGCVATTFDITAAYQLTPTCPNQQHSLCVFWKNKVYVDQAVIFGLSFSARVFGSIADMLITIYKAASFGVVIKWVDDFLAIHLSG